MPRRRRNRRMFAPPKFTEFKPIGVQSDEMPDLELLYEEYEAIKLADYDMLNHQDASVIMGISRATFARVYKEARKKIALAMVETRTLRCISGNVSFESNWMKCKDCESRFNHSGNSPELICPFCKSKNIISLNEYYTSQEKKKRNE